MDELYIVGLHKQGSREIDIGITSCSSDAAGASLSVGVLLIGNLENRSTGCVCVSVCVYPMIVLLCVCIWRSVIYTPPGGRPV